MSTVSAKRPRVQSNPRDSWPAWTDEVRYRTPRPATLTAVYGERRFELTALPATSLEAQRRFGVGDVRWMVHPVPAAGPDGRTCHEVTRSEDGRAFACSCGDGDGIAVTADGWGYAPGVPCVHLIALADLGLLEFAEPTGGDR